MKTIPLILLGCALPLYAAAQAEAQAPGPADPAAAVPPLAYRSVFPPAQGAALAAPGDWRRLNAEVGQFQNGHIDIIKWEARHATATGPVPPAAPSAAASAPGHKHGQGMHHHHGGQGAHGSHQPGSKP